MLVHGLDVVEIDRIRRAIDRFGDRFLNRIYTPAELELFKGRLLQLASRFAGKEAVMKALGGGISWREVEILYAESGEPQVSLSGRAEAKARERGIERFAISLSHSRTEAMASVIGEGR